MASGRYDRCTQGKVEASSMDDRAPNPSSEARQKRRRTLERSWVVGVVLFGFARFALAYSAFADESRMTVVIFGIIDFVTAVPYALGTARLVTSLVDRKGQAAAGWGAVASGCFMAPYLWMAWAGRTGALPSIVYWLVAVFVVCLGTNAVLTVRRRVKAERSERRRHHVSGTAGAAIDVPALASTRESTIDVDQCRASEITPDP